VSLAIDASRNGSVEGLQLLLQEWHETLCSVRIVKCKKLGTIGESIAQLGKLTELDLDECIIDTSLANAISHLSQLKSIQMKNCQLTARNAELIFNGCTNVEKIYIHEPKLALKDLDSILKLKKMKSFWYN
jgi:hypothetical protein